MSEQNTSKITAATLAGFGLPELMALVPQHANDPATLAVILAALESKSKPAPTTQKIRVQVSRKGGAVKVGFTGPAQPGASGGIGIWTDVHNLAGLKAVLTGPALWQTVADILAETPAQRQAAELLADAKRAKAAAAKAAKGSKTAKTDEPEDTGSEDIDTGTTASASTF